MQGLHQLLAFAQTARRRSFAAAARDLGCAPSTLAKSVARLEAGLGLRLFHRTTRQVSLTPDGERLYRRCVRVLAELDELHADAAGARAAPSGVLRVDLPIVYGRQRVMPLLVELLHTHPALELDLRLHDGHADLVREGVDLAVRIGELGDSSLIARRIDWQSLVLCASPGYLASHGTPHRIDELGGHAAVMFRLPDTGRIRPWQLREGSHTVELHPVGRVRLSDGDALVQAVSAGLGICQLPDYMVRRQLADGTLVELLPAQRPAPLPISAVMPPGRLQPPRVRALLDALDALDGLRGRSP